MTAIPLLSAEQARRICDLCNQLHTHFGWQQCIESIATGRARVVPVLTEAEERAEFEAWWARDGHTVNAGYVGSMEVWLAARGKKP